MPRSQIRPQGSTRPRDHQRRRAVRDDGITLGTLLIHVTLIQGKSARAWGGLGDAGRAGSGRQPRRWSAPAETSGQFKADRPVEAFGIVVMVVPDTDPNPDPAIARLHYETFTWSERVKLVKQL